MCHISEYDHSFIAVSMCKCADSKLIHNLALHSPLKHGQALELSCESQQS